MFLGTPWVVSGAATDVSSSYIRKDCWPNFVEVSPLRMDCWPNFPVITWTDERTKFLLKKIKEKMNEQKETSRPIILEKNKQNKSGDEL